MDTKSSERILNIHAIARVQTSSSYSSEVIIFQNHHVEILLQDKRSGSLIETLGSYPDPCHEGSSTLSLDFDNFTPSYIFQRLAKELHDCDLSRYITRCIFDESQRRDLAQGQPLLITVLVESTRKVYLEREEMCAICLDDFESKPMCMLPGCFHQFHRECLFEWIERRGHDSCPLCRHPVE
ncbi:hypothetical protein N665_0800s0028 [Sinapis alba]|nr:hypothetical protein N665_0800s0028 [Sinapis alba]